MSEPPLISVVSPVYRAEGIVDELVRRLVEQLEPMGTYEIILVDDRSPDRSWERIEAICATHAEVRGVRLSRNFGQHKAIAAGLAHARGRYVVVMDCDLQDNPKHIAALLEQAQAGHDIVYTLKREPTPLAVPQRHRTPVLRDHRLPHRRSGRPAGLGTGAYSLLTRRVVDEYTRVGDVHAHYLMNLRTIGFSHTHVEIEHEPRFEGRVLTVSSSPKRSTGDRRHRLAVRAAVEPRDPIGLGLFVTSLLGAVYLVVSYIGRGALAGYTSLMVMFLLLSGVILMSIGVLGLYVGRIFEQVKGRPLERRGSGHWDRRRWT